MEDDGRYISQLGLCRDFNPRPPGGGRHSGISGGGFGAGISIHVPRVEDDLVSRECADGKLISIHVPRVEDDGVTLAESYGFREFQSTSPGWRTTKAIAARERLECISIHVPRVEDDP